MAEDKKQTVLDDLSNDDVAVLQSILHSRTPISARFAQNVARLQTWSDSVVKERKISTKK